MDLIAGLGALGVHLSESPSDRETHGEDLTYHPARAPDAVAYPETSAEVAAVLAFANARGVPVVPFGAGTSLEGHVIPVAGGISLDLSRLTRIEIHADDLSATAQAGVTRSALNRAAGEHGLQFPVDPGADATLGGMAATNASGTTTVRYGGMRTQVLGLEVVLADGTVLHTGSRAFKSSAGYNLTGLFVGSEGTLGVITELLLRLYGIPEYAIAARASFGDLDAAVRAAVAMIGSGVVLTRVELLDALTLGAVNRYKEAAYPEAPSLFLEFGGTETGVTGEVEAAREICAAEDCLSFEFEREAEARSRLWEARHHAALALAATAPPGWKFKATDVCVPLSELPGAIRHARGLVEERGLEASIIGHVGDGNYHVGFSVDPADPAAIDAAEAVNHELVEYALARGGTCTGEHGIGLGKIDYLEAEHGDLIPAMQGIKRLLDPNGILNPGKVLR
ncbi:MAG: FAD-linked oxidase C-terminal domain-containing protein [Gaiellaceae bacterium]